MRAGAAAAELRGGAVLERGASAAAPGEGRGSRSGLAPLPVARARVVPGASAPPPGPDCREAVRGAVSECGPAAPLPSSASARRWAAVRWFGSSVLLVGSAVRQFGRGPALPVAPLRCRSDAPRCPARRIGAGRCLRCPSRSEIRSESFFASVRFCAELFYVRKYSRGGSSPVRSGPSLPTGMGESPSPGRFPCDLPVGTCYGAALGGGSADAQRSFPALRPRAAVCRLCDRLPSAGAARTDPLPLVRSAHVLGWEGAAIPGRMFAV